MRALLRLTAEVNWAAHIFAPSQSKKETFARFKRFMRANRSSQNRFFLRARCIFPPCRAETNFFFV